MQIRGLDIHRVVREKSLWASLSERNRTVSNIISSTTIHRIIEENLELLNDTIEIEIDLRSIEQELVCRFAVGEDHDYDDARRIVRSISLDLRDGLDLEGLILRLKKQLISEQRGVLKRFLIDECGLVREKVERTVRNVQNLDEVRIAAETISRSRQIAGSIDYAARVEKWESKVEELAHRFFSIHDLYRKLRGDEMNSFLREQINSSEDITVEPEEIHDLVKFVHGRISGSPHLKNIERPTIVLVGGTSGTGKSTISRHISRTLEIPTYASTDVIAREVVRRTISSVIGDETAIRAFPELFGSSFDGGDLEWYYAHSLMTMVGIMGFIENLIHEGRSAVIEGVPLIPGILPEVYYENANINWMVTSINDESEHFDRYAGRDKAGVSRGGAQRYRRKFHVIRMIHDRIGIMASEAHALLIDNTGSLERSLSVSLDTVKSPFADKGLWVSDEPRDSALINISSKMIGIEPQKRNMDMGPKLTNYGSSSEICGPSKESIEQVICKWNEKLQNEIAPLMKRIGSDLPSRDSPENTILLGRLQILKERSLIAREVLDPGIILSLLRNNFEFLRATRSLLIQLRSLHFYLLSRLTSVPGINYDEAKSDVYDIFSRKGPGESFKNALKAVKDLMFPELLNNIKVYLDSEYHFRENRISEAFEDISGLEILEDQLPSVLGRMLLVTEQKAVSEIHIRNIIELWEADLGQIIRKNFRIYEQWKDMEKEEMELLHQDSSLKDIKDRVSKEDLHSLIRWITPRLYDVPKVKNLEGRPTLILVHTVPGSKHSGILRKITNELSIPTCFNTSDVRRVMDKTLEWLMGSAISKRGCNPSPNSVRCFRSIEHFYHQASFSMIGIKGALDRLIKENTSAVITGDSMIPSMLEEEYFERSNVVAMLTYTNDREVLIKGLRESLFEPEGGDEDHIDLVLLEGLLGIGERMKDLAESGNIMVLDMSKDRDDLIEMVSARVTSPYSDRGLPVPDPARDTAKVEAIGSLEKIASELKPHFRGALMTDIDDTLLPSGITPDETWIERFSSMLRILARHGIIWSPMTGVALSKLGSRLLFRLPKDSVNRVIGYLGDGSQKVLFDEFSGEWMYDPSFTCNFSDAQAVAVIGSERFLREMEIRKDGFPGMSLFLERVNRAVEEVNLFNESSPPGTHPIDPERGLVGEMEEMLQESGLVDVLRSMDFHLSEAETYFRGGSVSWMMLGDISADPYEFPEAERFRKDIMIPRMRDRLDGLRGLSEIGERKVHIPFPGARGIKFVLEGNDKERGARDLIEKHGVDPERVLFMGNELYEGGNDNMLRNIEGFTLLSVGKREDPGAINWGVGVDDGLSLIEMIAEELESGMEFNDILRKFRKSSQTDNETCGK